MLSCHIILSAMRSQVVSEAVDLCECAIEAMEAREVLRSETVVHRSSPKAGDVAHKEMQARESTVKWSCYPLGCHHS